MRTPRTGSLGFSRAPGDETVDAFGTVGSVSPEELIVGVSGIVFNQHVECLDHFASQEFADETRYAVRAKAGQRNAGTGKSEKSREPGITRVPTNQASASKGGARKRGHSSTLHSWGMILRRGE